MANAERGDVALNVAGRDITLKLDTSAIVTAETAADRTIVTLVEDMQRGRISYAVILLWAMMQHHQPGTTQADVRAIFDELGLAAVTRAIEQALDRASVTREVEDGDPGNARAAA